MQYLKYFFGIIKHKYWVFRYALILKVPLYLALLHDVSKFHPVEFFAYANHFYNKNGTNRKIRDENGAYDINAQSNNFKRAWIHHQKNKHHWQAWCSIGDYGNIKAIDMPEKYIREMIADWCGAGMSINGKPTPVSWYDKNYLKMKLSKTTQDKLSEILWLECHNRIEIFD